jgi:4-amino-4-deoxy-L-arabinose transferase-like glycosyltransferase
MPAAPLTRSTVIALVWVGLLFAALWIATLGLRKVTNPDEGRYAEIPREMVVSGDWLTPRLNDLKYFEKPPLQYWATAVAYEIFGVTDFASRLWCGLTGLAGILVAGWMGARLFGRDAGIAAAAVLASSLIYVVLGHLNTLDMGLSFFMQVAIGSFLLAQHAPSRSTSERNFMLLAWTAVAFAVLSKGIVAMALPVLTLLAYTVVEREYSSWRRLHMAIGLPIFFVIAAPWFIAVSLKNPEFASFFFLHEHFQRFLTDEAQRVEAWWYFIPLLIVGALPWTGLAGAATVNAWRFDRTAQTDSSFRSRRFLILWIAVSMVFFSISQSKLAPYILPVFPAIAWLVGDYVVRSSPALIRRHLIGIAIFWLLGLAYVVFGPLPKRNDVPPEIFAEVFRWLAAGCALALIGTGSAWLLARRERLRDALLCACGGSLLAVSILLIDFDVARRLRSSYDLVQTILPLYDSKKPFYSIWTYDHSLSFYLGRPVTLVQYSGELLLGQQQEPAKSLPDFAAFQKAWDSDPPGTIAVMKPDAFQHLVASNVPMVVIGRNVQLTAVKKP